MKRVISLLLAAAMIFLLASCSGKEDSETTTNNLPPVIEDTVHTKEFTDDSGKTVIKVKVTLPQIIDNCDEKVMNYLNSVALDEFTEACEFAESNIENASNFMKSMNSDKPWSKTVTFENTHLSNRYACFIVKEALSYFDSEVTPEWRTVCYNIRTGAECKLSDFTTYTDDPELGFETFLNDILAPALPVKFTNPSHLSDDVYDRLDEIVSTDNFYLTENGMGFYFDKRDVHEYLSGTFKISFTWQELSSVYELPN